MSLNLRRVFDLVQKEYKNFTFEKIEDTREKMRLQAEIVAKDYFDDGVLVQITMYEGGTVHVFMTFDHLDKTLRAYDLINDFNDSVSFYRAYISTKKNGDYLELHATSICGANDENDVADTISYLINQILNDSVLEYLQPLTNMTY